MLIPWDTKLTEIDGEEISVEYREQFQYTASIAHNFVRKTYLTLAFCDICRGLLLNGFRCQTCGYKFHQRCASNVPTLCIFENRIMPKNSTVRPLGGNKGHDTDNYEVHSPNEISGAGSKSHGNTSSGGGGGGENGDTKLSMRERTYSAPNVTYVHTVKQRREQRMKQSWSLDTSSSSHMDEQQYDMRRSSTLPSSVTRDIEKFNTLPSMKSSSISLSQFHQSSNQRASHPPTTPPAVLTGGPAPSPPLHPVRQGDDTATSDASGQSTAKLDMTTHGKERQGRPRSRTSPERKGKQRPRQPNNDEWEIPNTEILIGERVGSGSFGTVFKGHWHGAVAVKKLNVKSPNPSQLQAFKNEVCVLRKTRHVNIVLFMGWLSRPYLAIVTQWCEGSSLYKHLHVFETKFEMLQLVEIGKQTAQGME
jgi:hypothetical protein